MIAAEELQGMLASAAGRSALYGMLARCFRHPLEVEAHPVTGAAFDAAFDPAISNSATALREASYWKSEQSAVFEDLLRFFEHFGLARADGAELPDHLSVELQFMHFLAHLEERAGGDLQAIASLTLAQRDFLGRHLRRLVHAVQDGLRSDDAACRELVALAVFCVDAEFARTTRGLQA